MSLLRLYLGPEQLVWTSSVKYAQLNRQHKGTKSTLTEPPIVPSSLQGEETYFLHGKFQTFQTYVLFAEKLTSWSDFHSINSIWSWLTRWLTIIPQWFTNKAGIQLNLIRIFFEQYLVMTHQNYVITA